MIILYGKSVIHISNNKARENDGHEKIFVAKTAKGAARRMSFLQMAYRPSA